MKGLLLGIAGFLLLMPGAGFSQAAFPSPVGFVNDFAEVISPGVESQINAICLDLRQKTGAQLVVVTVKTVGDEHYVAYANKLFEAWGIGEKGKDNGVLLLQTIQERSFWMEIGYGLEGLIPDGLAGQIRDQHVFPHFRAGDAGAGHLSGVKAVAGLIAKDAGVEITGAVAPVVRRGTPKRQRGRGKFVSLLFMALFFLLARRGRGGLLPLLLLGGLSGGSRHHGHSGGGFGGGFGGFGGGMSGGGGAGGSY